MANDGGSDDFNIDEFLEDGLEEELPNFKVPNLGDKPKGYLIDRLGVIKDRVKRLKKYEKMFGELIKKESPQPAPTMEHWGDRGNKYLSDITLVTTTRLDTNRVKEEYPEVYQACLKDNTTTKLLIKEIK